MTSATCENPQTVQPNTTLEQSEALSIHSVHSAIALVMPEVLTRATREPYFRESILQDPHITLESIIKHTLNTDVKIPEFMKIKVVEDTPNKVNLVVPQFNEDTQPRGGKMAAVVWVLLQAAQDRDLAEKIQRSPREVLERYTASASGSPVAFDAGLELAVHIPDPEEIVIVLSERGDSRVAYSQSIDAELSLYSEADVLAYHTDTGFGCTTAYTFCFTGCHSCSCHTNSTYSGCCR